MKCALFLALLLLLRLLPSAETRSSVPAPTKDPLLMLDQTNGSTCAQWLCGMSPPRMKAFGCPKQPGGAKVKFCCGNCGQTRNCSFEEPAEGSSARPTDGEPQPSLPTERWLLVISFIGGALSAVIFYWGFYLPCKKFLCTKTYTLETPEEIEGENGSSVRRRSTETYTRLNPPLPIGALGPLSLRDDNGPTDAFCNQPRVDPPAQVARSVTVMWFSTGLIPMRMGPTPPQPNLGNQIQLIGPEN